MRSSRLTLKAVNILAIELRGVVRQCLGRDQTPIERRAMGSMTAGGLGEDLDITVVSTKLGKSAGKDAGKTKAVDIIRSEKFTIKLSEYLAKREAEEESRRRLNHMSGRSVTESSSRRGREVMGLRDFELDEEDRSDIEELFLV